MRSRMTKKACSLAILLGLSMILPGCGGDDSSVAPTPVATTTLPPAPVNTVIAEGSFSGLPSITGVEFPFVSRSRGDIRVTVDWTFATNDVDIFLRRASDPLK